MTFQAEARIGGNLRVRLWDGEYRKWGIAEVMPRCLRPEETNSLRLDDNSALVQQGASCNRRVQQVLAQGDVIGDQGGFRWRQGVLRKEHVLRQLGAQLVLFVLGI